MYRKAGSFLLVILAASWLVSCGYSDPMGYRSPTGECDYTPPDPPERNCDNVPIPDSGGPIVVPASLTATDDCGALLRALKQATIERMRQRVLANMNQYWTCGCWRQDYSCGGGGGGSGGAMDASMAADGSSYYPDPEDPPDEEGAEEYSTTNNQEEGVDEADFVKNDGQYIYILAGRQFMIIEAWPALSTHVLSTHSIEGAPQRMFVHNDRALIYSDVPEDPFAAECRPDIWTDGGWNNWCPPQRNNLRVTVLNIADRRNPFLEREIMFFGSYVSSRRIGNAVYTVAAFPEPSFPTLRYCPDDLWCNESVESRRCAFYRLIQRNEQIINDARFSNWLPTISDTRHYSSGSTFNSNLLGDCRNFLHPSLLGEPGFLTVTSLDIQDLDKPVHLSSVTGQTGTVYASHEALYVASQHIFGRQQSWFWEDPSLDAEATTIHKFSLCREPIESHYEASGVVKGRMLNQFSMGEHNHHLRTATTTGQVWEQSTHNSVFVLEQNGGRLDVIGSLTGIAPTEEIRSARFVGDRGFVVTFKKTDPLYALDLSVPTTPRIAGELKIPGFSTYIHMMDPDHLLTIGFDAEDHGSFAYFQGIELQIFDVSDMSDPTQLHKEIIGTRGSTSEATGNHLAFNYFPPKDLLALPMAICDGNAGGSSYGTMTFDGLLVYDVTLEAGFSERGRVSHIAPGGDWFECENWWTDPDSGVKRSIIMDDYVFSISSTLIKVNHLDNLADDVITLSIPPIPGSEPPREEPRPGGD